MNLNSDHGIASFCSLSLTSCPSKLVIIAGLYSSVLTVSAAGIEEKLAANLSESLILGVLGAAKELGLGDEGALYEDGPSKLILLVFVSEEAPGLADEERSKELLKLDLGEELELEKLA